MKSGENYNSSRRGFLKGIAVSALVLPFLNSCKEKALSLVFRLTGTHHVLGHRLWTKNFPKPTETHHVECLIVGGGISGLSAARHFVKKGMQDFLLLEMENHLGGNSSNGENRYSKFPLGAHYLPLPNFQDKELLQFLSEEKIITGYDVEGYPIFDEEQLTFSPQERLFYKNNWQEGLVPKYGNSAKEDNDFEAFFAKMDFFRTAKDEQGNYYFDIPLSLSSDKNEIRALDNSTMRQWLQEQNLTSQPLLDYVDYCCRDDFGLGIASVSAWAGIHYFAGRKHDSVKEDRDNVLTWPEGNARLATHLKKYSEKKALKNHLVYSVQVQNDKVHVLVFDEKKNSSKTIIADKVLMATPQFVNQYLFEGRKDCAKNFHYAPWMLATLTVNELWDNASYPLCWDNVVHGSKGLGYIYDQHQSVEQLQSKKVLTYYYSFSDADTRKSRRFMYKQSQAYWKQLVFNDLKIPHPTIESQTQTIEVHRLGHGMISPVPGFIFGEAKQKAAKPIENKIYFAHSDLSGISIFEEAFHQGIKAADAIIYGTTLDT
ncbi:NAD(P)-binding protein [Flavobacterium sp. SM15]|uniref:NAD(P)/FAD-dependent oxidoreductase n=1 Tax=Flavobacterium sp. SM15 TaxID=2908005 RepID=UPI001EDB3CCB|nr:NAD(P)/FAD-dependent oxidoreductase [Flavobacterium sp. SM15]MCG2610074.1 NAD(P)-binding protein [Flavobacterium sp. SM15]